MSVLYVVTRCRSEYCQALRSKPERLTRSVHWPRKLGLMMITQIKANLLIDERYARPDGRSDLQRRRLVRRNSAAQIDQNGWQISSVEPPESADRCYALSKPIGIRKRPVRIQFVWTEQVGSRPLLLAEFTGTFFVGESASIDPVGALFSERSIRGGSWNSSPPNVRIANRSSDLPSLSFNTVGFRLAED